jgi:hypothetical protein
LDKTPTVLNAEGKPITDKPLPSLNPDVKPIPSNAVVPDVEKTNNKINIPSTPTAITETVKPVTPVSSITPETTKPVEPAKPLTPETTKVIPPTPSSITESNITNNNSIDKKALSDIVNNTDKTNKSLLTLSDAVFALAKVFDSKSMSSNSYVINSGNGQAQEYTSSASIATNNVDTIRGVRQQFLAAV